MSKIAEMSLESLHRLNSRLTSRKAQLVLKTEFLLEGYSVKIESWKKRVSIQNTLYCGKGCGLCCNMLNWVTLAEASLLFGRLDKSDKDRFRGMEKRLFRLAQQTDPEKLFEVYRHEIGPCPLLSRDFSCRHHPHRPLSCRSAFSFFPPFLCRADLLKRHGFQRINALIDRHPSDHYHETPYAIEPIVWRDRAVSRLGVIMNRTLSMTVAGTLPTLIGLLCILNKRRTHPEHSGDEDTRSWIRDRNNLDLIAFSSRSDL